MTDTIVPKYILLSFDAKKTEGEPADYEEIYDYLEESHFSRDKDGKRLPDTVWFREYKGEDLEKLREDLWLGLHPLDVRKLVICLAGELLVDNEVDDSDKIDFDTSERISRLPSRQSKTMPFNISAEILNADYVYRQSAITPEGAPYESVGYVNSEGNLRILKAYIDDLGKIESDWNNLKKELKARGYSGRYEEIGSPFNNQ